MIKLCTLRELIELDYVEIFDLVKLHQMEIHADDNFIYLCATIDDMEVR